MACSITNGREWQCKEQTGGIVAVYFANFGELTGLTVADGAIASGLDTAVGGGKATLYKFALPKDTANLSDVLNVSTENGTVEAEQTLEITLHKLQAADRNKIRLIATGRPHVIVEDRNGNNLLLGFKRGVDVTSATAQTGTAGTDLSGYTISMVGKEKEQAPYITQSLSDATIVTS